MSSLTYYKMVISVIVLLCSLSSTVAKPGFAGNQYGAMPYQFQYYVNEPDYGNDFGHRESSDGNLVEGEYYVLLPDGRRQTVTYKADHKSGFVADVKYDGGVGGIGGGGGYN